jgi:hypothetical protein
MPGRLTVTVSTPNKESLKNKGLALFFCKKLLDLIVIMCHNVAVGGDFMTLAKSQTKNAMSLYVTKCVREDGRRTTKVVEKLGTVARPSKNSWRWH